MATRGTLITRLHSELHLTSQTAVLSNAVTTAIDTMKHERFWFNEYATTLTLSATSVYAVPSDLLQIDTFRADHAGSTYDLSERSWPYMESLDYLNVTASPPSYYAVHHEMLRIYPTPNSTMTAHITGVKDITCTASASASTVWTNEAEELIRTIAAIDVCENFTRDYAHADRLRGRVPAIFESLAASTIKRRGGGKMKPYL